MFCPFLENREEEKMINKLVAKIKETKAPIVVSCTNVPHTTR